MKTLLIPKKQKYAVHRQIVKIFQSGKVKSLGAPASYFAQNKTGKYNY